MRGTKLILSFLVAVVLINCGTPSQGGFRLKSSAFSDGDYIPVKYACTDEPNGQNISPPLEWENAPEGTKSFALIMYDPDANNFIHWVVYDIPSSYNALKEGASGSDPNITEGINDYSYQGYAGPCPPIGDPAHTYVLKLYALSVDSLGLEPGAAYKEVENAMQGKILETAQLTGKYKAQ